MARCNPTSGPFKPHLKLFKQWCWVVCYKDVKSGVLYSAVQVTFSTSHSKKAIEAKIWATNANARLTRQRLQTHHQANAEYWKKSY